jgi:hypothetical protein
MHYGPDRASSYANTVAQGGGKDFPPEKCGFCSRMEAMRIHGFLEPGFVGRWSRAHCGPCLKLNATSTCSGFVGRWSRAHCGPCLKLNATSTCSTSSLSPWQGLTHVHTRTATHLVSWHAAYPV